MGKTVYTFSCLVTILLTIICSFGKSQYICIIMKPIRHILCLSVLLLSISVAFGSSTHYIVKADFVKKYEYNIAPTNDPSVIVFHFEAIVPAPTALDSRREYVQVKYEDLKPNNKALPLGRKLWLINCQIALK